MSAEARLYTFSPETKAALRKFRLSTSRSNTLQAKICTFLLPWSPPTLPIPSTHSPYILHTLSLYPPHTLPISSTHSPHILHTLSPYPPHTLLQQGISPILTPICKEDLINKTTHEIHAEDDTTHTDLQTLTDDLPDHSPRYILLSYPLTMSSGRNSVPYVMLYYLPVTCNAESKMVYASAKELVKNTAEVQRIIEVGDIDEVLSIEEKLKGEE